MPAEIPGRLGKTGYVHETAGACECERRSARAVAQSRSEVCSDGMSGGLKLPFRRVMISYRAVTVLIVVLISCLLSAEDSVNDEG